MSYTSQLIANAALSASLEKKKEENRKVVKKALAESKQVIPREYNLKVRVETLSPERCAELLATSVGNRPTSPTNLKRLKDAMKQGEFMLLPDPMVISDKGRLMNAHHRAKAAEETDTPIEMLIVEGLPEELFTYLDTNCKTRSQADALAIHLGSEKNLNHLKATLQALADYELNVSVSREKLDNNDIIVVNDLYPEAQWWADRLNVPRTPLVGYGSVTAALVLIERAGNDREDIVRFHECLRDGFNLAKGCPIGVLRNKIISLRSKDRAESGRRKRDDDLTGITTQQARMWLMRSVIHVWNKHIAGKTLQSLNAPKSNISPKRKRS